MKFIVEVCLNPACIWVSLPWPARLWWRSDSGPAPCPRCRGRIIIVTTDTVLMDPEHDIERRSHMKEAA